MRLEGITDLQRDLLRTAQQTPKNAKKIMNKIGSKATSKVRKKSKSLVKKKTGKFQKKWKKGKVFLDSDGKWVVRVINSAPHAHLIEDGHVLKIGGQVKGFVPGKKVLEKGMQEFYSSGDITKIVSELLDDLLSSNRL